MNHVDDIAKLITNAQEGNNRIESALDLLEESIAALRRISDMHVDGIECTECLSIRSRGYIGCVQYDLHHEHCPVRIAGEVLEAWK